MHNPKWRTVTSDNKVYYLGTNCSLINDTDFTTFTGFKYYVQDSFFLANDNDQLTFKEISNEIFILCWFVFLNRIGLYKIKE